MGYAATLNCDRVPNLPHPATILLLSRKTVKDLKGPHDHVVMARKLRQAREINLVETGKIHQCFLMVRGDQFSQEGLLELSTM
jgi:hypothetical protein